VIPIVTPAEMAEVDRQAPEPEAVLIERAGYQVARAARAMLSGCYGRRVVVVAGAGNNGADGRAAAAVLRAHGAVVSVLDAPSVAGRADAGWAAGADLIIDAAYGTGLRRPYAAPDPGPVPVLAVDIPSGLSGLTGEPPSGGDEADGSSGTPVRADRTVTFQAYKPGLLLGAGPEHTGPVDVVDIGLGRLVEEAAGAWLIEDRDLVEGWPRRGRNAHKWQHAVQVVGGSPGMYGAPWMLSRSALRAGAGYVRVAVPGAPLEGGLPPGEYVSVRLPAAAWATQAAEDGQRVRALVVGPGLGPATGGATGPDSEVGRLLRALPDTPAVVDADGLTALADLDGVAAVTAARSAPTVLTPHDGEFTRLAGHPPGADRLAEARAAAARAGAVLLLKGTTTVVAHPDGRALLVNSGSSRLATAGTGDVLSGAIGAALAGGLDPLEAAAFAAHAHGRAASLGYATGLTASDLPDLIAAWLSQVVGE
jgi:NAD(P)H-hydrate epimerase